MLSKLTTRMVFSFAIKTRELLRLPYKKNVKSNYHFIQVINLSSCLFYG